MSDRHFVVRDRCPACREVDFRVVYECDYLGSAVERYLVDFYAESGGIEREYLAGGRFVLAECQKCRTVFQQEIPGELLMRKLYEEWIDPEKEFRDYERGGNLTRFSSYAREVMTAVAYFKKRPGELKFLDFGMGWGRWIRIAHAFDCDAYGMELSEAKVAYARARGIKILSWNELSAHRFDFINTEQVFEHIPDPLGTLEQLALALAPGGLIKLSVPNGKTVHDRLRQADWNAPRGSKRDLNMVSPLEHINCFQRESLIKMAGIAGLREVRLPLHLQIGFSTHWLGLRQLVMNVAWPVYKNVLRQGTYLFFSQASKTVEHRESLAQRS